MDESLVHVGLGRDSDSDRAVDHVVCGHRYVFAVIVCAFRGHKYRIVQTFGAQTRRVCCKRCYGDWAMNDELQCLLPWDEDFEELYRGMGFNVLPGRECLEA